jgi:hypothetical protein
MVYLGPRRFDLGYYLPEQISLELLYLVERSFLVLWSIWRILFLAILVRVVLPLLLGMGMDLVGLVERFLVVVNVKVEDRWSYGMPKLATATKYYHPHRTLVRQYNINFPCG